MDEKGGEGQVGSAATVLGSGMPSSQNGPTCISLLGNVFVVSMRGQKCSWQGHYVGVSGYIVSSDLDGVSKDLTKTLLENLTFGSLLSLVSLETDKDGMCQ